LVANIGAYRSTRRATQSSQRIGCALLLHAPLQARGEQDLEPGLLPGSTGERLTSRHSGGLGALSAGAPASTKPPCRFRSRRWKRSWSGCPWRTARSRGSSPTTAPSSGL
jgi:hypothetical protein